MESNKKIGKQLSLIKLSNRKTIESNPVENGCQNGTADSNDGARVGYLMLQREGS